MSDLIERLRIGCVYHENYYWIVESDHTNALLDEAADEIERLRDAVSDLEWKPMDIAPRDRIIIAMARYPHATAGSPSFVGWGGALGWCEFSLNAPQPVVCWAWIDRSVLPSWPDEPATQPPTDRKEAK